MLRNKTEAKAVTQWSINYSPCIQGCGTIGVTFLHVGTMVNAPSYNRLYLFLYFLCHPFVSPIFVENYHFLVYVCMHVCLYVYMKLEAAV